jgi:hypothetical protein
MFKSKLMKGKISLGDAYRSASPEDRQEYDRYGPWVLEVRSELELPKAFRGAWPELREYSLLLKVPRREERRDLRPGMDLYRAVLGLGGAGCILLSLDEAGVQRQTVAWSQVAAVRGYQNLLFGRWELLLADGGAISVNYNTVSGRVMDQATRVVRDHLPGDHAQAPAAGAAVTVEDHFFRAELMDLQDERQDAVTVLFDRPGRRVRNERGRRRLSTGAMVLDAGFELIIVDRAPVMRPRWSADYGHQRTFLPLAGIAGFTLSESTPPVGDPVHTLALEMGAQRLETRFLDDPAAVAGLLRKRGVQERRPVLVSV